MPRVTRYWVQLDRGILTALTEPESRMKFINRGVHLKTTTKTVDTVAQIADCQVSHIPVYGSDLFSCANTTFFRLRFPVILNNTLEVEECTYLVLYYGHMHLAKIVDQKLQVSSNTLMVIDDVYHHVLDVWMQFTKTEVEKLKTSGKLGERKIIQCQPQF